jgi:hypothetical protein
MSNTGGVEAGGATAVAQPGWFRATHAWKRAQALRSSTRFRPSHDLDVEVYLG